VWAFSFKLSTEGKWALQKNKKKKPLLSTLSVFSLKKPHLLTDGAFLYKLLFFSCQKAT
jgi:hypothetical protein